MSAKELPLHSQLLNYISSLSRRVNFRGNHLSEGSQEGSELLGVPLLLRRLDYFVLSERLVKDLCDCVPRTGVYGSDHCPLVLSMAMD